MEGWRSVRGTGLMEAGVRLKEGRGQQRTDSMRKNRCYTQSHGPTGNRWALRKASEDVHTSGPVIMKYHSYSI